MAELGAPSGAQVREVSPEAFARLTGLEVTVTPIRRVDQVAGGRISVRSASGDQIVPARVAASGVLHGLPDPVGPQGGPGGRWTVSPTVFPSSRLTDEATVHSSQVLTERAPTVDVVLAPGTIVRQPGEDVVSWRSHRLVVHVEATGTPEAGDLRAKATLPTLEIQQLLVGVPKLVVVSPSEIGPSTSGATVVVAASSGVRTREQARQSIRQAREAFDILPGSVPITMLRELESVIGLLDVVHDDIELLVARHGAAVLPGPVEAATALGAPGSRVNLVLPAAAPGRATGLVITIADGGLTTVRRLRSMAPASSPVQHVELIDLGEPWLAACSPLLHLVD